MPPTQPTQPTYEYPTVPQLPTNDAWQNGPTSHLRTPIKILLAILVLVVLGGLVVLAVKSGRFFTLSKSSCTQACGQSANSLTNVSWGIQGIVYASSGNASYANQDFSQYWTGTETLPNATRVGGASSWIAYNLNGIPHQNVVLVWYNDLPWLADATKYPHIASPYDHELAGHSNEKAWNLPSDYTIDAATGDGSTVPTDWTTLVSVTGNTYHSRQHVLDLSKYTWVRMRITAIDPDSIIGNTHASLHMDIYTAPQPQTPYRNDYLILGETSAAVSVGQMMNPGTSIQELVKQKNGQLPIVENASIGGYRASDLLTLLPNGETRLDNWLNMFPGKYVGVSLGAGDILLGNWLTTAPSCSDTATPANVANLTTVIQDIIQRGKTPILPTVMWGPDIALNTCADYYNQNVIQPLYAKFGSQIVQGPDLYNTFHSLTTTAPANYTTYFDANGAAPAGPGKLLYRQAWAAVLSKL